MSRRDHLRAYLATLVGELIARRVIGASDPVDVILKYVTMQMMKDVKEDLRSVLSDLGKSLAEEGLRAAGTAVGQMFVDLANRIGGRRK